MRMSRPAAALTVALVCMVLATACGSSGRALRDPKDGAVAPARQNNGSTSTTASTTTTTPRATAAIGSGFALSSDAWTNGQAIPKRFTCDGANVSPPLAIANAPAGTVEFLLVVTDRDVPGQTQWIVATIPARTTAFPEASIPPGAVELTNTSGGARWSGPCPTSGQHTYQFSLYALPTASALSKASDRAAVETVTRRATAVATYDGTYARP